jgi:hypothetical protein
MPRISQQQGDGTGAARPFPEDGEAARRPERKSKTFALLALADPPQGIDRRVEKDGSERRSSPCWQINA